MYSLGTGYACRHFYENNVWNTLSVHLTVCIQGEYSTIGDSLDSLNMLRMGYKSKRPLVNLSKRPELVKTFQNTRKKDWSKRPHKTSSFFNRDYSRKYGIVFSRVLLSAFLFLFQNNDLKDCIRSTIQIIPHYVRSDLGISLLLMLSA